MRPLPEKKNQDSLTRRIVSLFVFVLEYTVDRTHTMDIPASGSTFKVIDESKRKGQHVLFLLN